MNNNITPTEFLRSAFYYSKDVGRIVLTDSPKEYADAFRDCLFHAGFQIRDFHYQVASEAVDAMLDTANNAEELMNMDVYTLEELGYIQADCYTSDLVEWAKDSNSIESLNEAIQDCGPFANYIELLTFAQYNHKRDIYALTLTAVQEFLSLNA